MKNNCGRNKTKAKDTMLIAEDILARDRKLESKNGGLTYKPFNIQKQFTSNHSLNQQSSGENSANSQ